MDRPNEVTAYLYGDMDHLSSHFCHVYDRKTMRITDGCLWRLEFIAGNDPTTAKIWHDWN